MIRSLSQTPVLQSIRIRTAEKPVSPNSAFYLVGVWTTYWESGAHITSSLEPPKYIHFTCLDRLAIDWEFLVSNLGPFIVQALRQ